MRALCVCVLLANCQERNSESLVRATGEGKDGSVDLCEVMEMAVVYSGCFQDMRAVPCWFERLATDERYLLS